MFVRSNGNKELIGRVLYAKKIHGKVTHSGFTIRARNQSNEVLSEYCAIFCSSSLVKQQFMTKGGGSSISNLNQKLLSEIEIPLPPLKEQKEIIDILTTWAKAINLKETLIEQKKDQKKGLMQKLLVGEIRMPGFYEEWDNKLIGDLIIESKEVAHEADLNKKITVKLNLKGIEKRSFSAIEKEGATTQYLRKAGQFIYGKQNLHKGALGLIPEELDGFQTSTDIPAFDFRDEVNPLWFYYYFARENYYTDLEKISTGTGSKRIQPKNLYKLPIKVPSLAEQEAISRLLSTFDKEINLLKKESKEYQKQRKALMQTLLTGKIRVKV